MRLAFVMACACAAICLAEDNWEEQYLDGAPVDYTGHKLVRFSLKSSTAKDLLDEAAERHGVDLLQEVRGHHAIARVPPSTDLSQVALQHEVLHEDISPLLLSELSTAGKGFEQRYHDLPQIEAYLKQLQDKYPKVVRLEQLGKSAAGHPITVVHVLAAPAHPSPPTVFVLAGQHAREWIGPAASLAVLTSLAERAAKAGGLAGWQLSMVPVGNPDGYQYTRTKDRFWRKNRDTHPKRTAMELLQSNKEGAQLNKDIDQLADATDESCVGVDLNRQWGAHWAQTTNGAGEVSPDPVTPCSDTFQGYAALVEPEVRAVSSHIASRKGMIKAFMDVHSFSQRLLPPGCNGYASPQKDVEEQTRVAKAVVTALSSGKAQYQTGPCGEEMYVCSGTAADWAYQQQGILHSYSLELRPDNALGDDGFVVPPDQIAATGQELLAGLEVLAKQL